MIRSHWDTNAQDWRLVGPPLRPAPEDIAVYEEALAAFSKERRRPPRALLLGVTPEIATMRWPAGTSLLALDRSGGMLRHVWPASAAPHAVAVQGDWLRMPLADASRDCVIGDNAIHHRYPDGHRAVLASLRRVLAPDGLLVLRYFCAPDTPETPRHVFDELRAGRIGNFHIFKWRLAVALQTRLEDGITWGAVWEAWNAEIADPQALMRSRGWLAELLRTIEVYRGSVGRLNFPNFAQVLAALREDFEPIRQIVPRYELGERCPIVIARPR